MSIQPNDIAKLHELRNDYIPSRVRILFVGESVPQNGTFFYNGDSLLYRNTEKAFIWQAGKEFTLEHFKKYGCWLYDVCDSPVNGLAPKERRKHIKDGVPALLKTIARHKPEFIIVVKKGDMRSLVFKAVCYEAGYVENETAFNLPFPACGNQLSYCNELAEIVIKLNIGDDAEPERRNLLIQRWSTGKKQLANTTETCPVCGQHAFKCFGESCPICNWEHDLLQYENHDEEGGANSMSVNQARDDWSKKRISLRGNESLWK